MAKKAQITLTTNAKVKARDEVYVHRMGMTMSGVLNTLLYKLYYDGGQLPYRLSGNIKKMPADTLSDVQKRIDHDAQTGNVGKKFDIGLKK